MSPAGAVSTWLLVACSDAPTQSMVHPAGPAAIHIRYTGVLNNNLRGFYLSRANGRRYAVTQLESTDARRAFPSFDEPIYKATFEISMLIDNGDTAISNGAQVSDTPGPEPGKHTVVFARTLKMSSYLVAMIVGDFVCRQGASDGTPLRVCATPDKLAPRKVLTTRPETSPSTTSNGVGLARSSLFWRTM